MQLIFKLPDHYNIPIPLAYIRTFKGPQQVSGGPLKRVNMHRVERSRYTVEYQPGYEEEVIPLSFIRCTCHLIPSFGGDTLSVDDLESAPDPLELFEEFYLNSYFDLHTFQFS
jgi:hypothetical protein